MMFIRDSIKHLLEAFRMVKPRSLLGAGPKLGAFPPKPDTGNFSPSGPFVPIEPLPEQHWVDHQAEAEFVYENWQLQEGRELFQSGIPPQNASELQNLGAYQASVGMEETSTPFDSLTPETFAPQDDFCLYGDPTEPIDDMQQPFDEPQPAEMSDMNDPGMMGSAYGFETMGDAAQLMENMQPTPDQQAQKPMPEAMEDPMQENPDDPIDPMMDPFGMMMDPFGMGGPFGS